MQQNFLELWETLNRASLDLVNQVSASNQAVFNSLLNDFCSLSSVGKFGKASLDASNAWAELGKTALNQAVASPNRAGELDKLAGGIEELGEIFTNMAQAITEQQTKTFSALLGDYAASLRALDKSATAEEVLASHTRYVTHLQDRLKASSEESLQLFNSLNAGLKAWLERYLDTLAEKPTEGG